MNLDQVGPTHAMDRALALQKKRDLKLTQALFVEAPKRPVEPVKPPPKSIDPGKVPWITIADPKTLARVHYSPVTENVVVPKGYAIIQFDEERTDISKVRSVMVVDATWERGWHIMCNVWREDLRLIAIKFRRIYRSGETHSMP